MHYLQKITCPDCGIRLEIDLWNDADGESHQIMRLYKKDGTLVLEVAE